MFLKQSSFIVVFAQRKFASLRLISKPLLVSPRPSVNPSRPPDRSIYCVLTEATSCDFGNWSQYCFCQEYPFVIHNRTMESGNGRVCAGCYQIGQSLLCCTRCKAYCYCNKTCQTAHWKLIHRKTCKPQDIIPPKEIESFEKFNIDLNWNDSLDIRYNYIVLKPCKSITDLKQNIDTLIVGCDDDDLENYISSLSKRDSSRSDNNSGNISNDTTAASTDNIEAQLRIQNRYEWINGINSTTLPGYSMDYNGVNKMVAYHDAYTLTATSLDYTLTGTYTIMSGRCHGNVVITCRNSDEGMIPISRQEVLTIIVHNYACSELNTVSSRVHFENIRRNEAKLMLHKQGYNIL